MSRWGVDVINPLLDAYLAFEEAPNDVIDKVVVGTNGIAQIQMPDTISLVSDWSPSKKLFYVVDFNDGSVYIGDLMDEHIGLNVTHIYLGRGDYRPQRSGRSIQKPECGRRSSKS